MASEGVSRVEVLLKEYDTLREESLNSMGYQSQIVAFGLGTIGAIAGGSLALSNRPDFFVVAVFDIAIPIISILVLATWLGEVERMMRAGRYLVGLEDRINVECKDRLLRWEHVLRDGQQMRYPYIAVIALFLGLAVGAPIVARSLLSADFRAHWIVAVADWTITAMAAGAIWRHSTRLG